MTIEDYQPDPARNEAAVDTQIVQTLIGKRVGDVVDVPGATIQVQQERLVEIQSKYTRLFQDAMSNFQHRFPGAGAIQSIHVGSDDNFDPTPIVDSLKGRRDHVDSAMEAYRENLCSLHLLASQLGIDQRQLIIGLTGEESHFLRCVECSPQEFAITADTGFSEKKVVLDLSAIVTISRLDAWKHLDESFEYLVSRDTLDTLTEWLRELTEREVRPAGYASLGDDGNMVFREVTEEQFERELIEVQRMVCNTKSVCTVTDTIAIAAIDPMRREKYIDVLGVHTLQAISIAKDEGVQLWTDDLFVAIVGELDFGVKRIWTQAAFKALEHKELVNEEVFSALTAKLAGWNYISTIWNAKDLTAAGELCDWDVDAWPLKQCIRLIGTSALPTARKAHTAIEFFGLLRRSNCTDLKKSPVVQTTLNEIGSVEAVKWIFQNLDQFFPIDFPWAEFLRPEMLYWLKRRQW